MVRRVLKETLAGGDGRSEAPPAGFSAALRTALSRGKPARMPVVVRNAADLDRFARDLLEAADSVDLKAAILAGEVRFEMPPVSPENKSVTAKPSAASGSYQAKPGVLGEAKIVELARAHSRILIGGDVVVTPLAREKAREMKIELVRQKP
jgi:hypothetical protein